MLKICLIFLFFLIVFPHALAQYYYADIQIDISPEGQTDISGSTNHPSISSIANSDDFTTKNKGYWVFNLSVEESFSQYIAEIRFPPKTSLNYIKASKILSIKEDNGRIVVTIIGNEEPLLFMAQYSFNENEEITSWLFYANFIILIIFTLSLIVYYFFQKEEKPKKNLELDSLTDREKLIVETIKKNKGRITQAELEKSLEIPKSSLSRNIDSLVRKTIILKSRKGMTNYIIFNDKKV